MQLVAFHRQFPPPGAPPDCRPRVPFQPAPGELSVPRGQSGRPEQTNLSKRTDQDLRGSASLRDFGARPGAQIALGLPGSTPRSSPHPHLSVRTLQRPILQMGHTGCLPPEAARVSTQSHKAMASSALLSIPYPRSRTRTRVLPPGTWPSVEERR